MILSNVKNFLIKNRYILVCILLFTLLFSLSSDFALAANETVKPEKDWSGTAGLINTALGAVGAIVWIFTYFITLFLEPGWINGTVFWLDTYFKDIWILVSNVVYFIFAFLLIWIAFMNIVWNGGEKYQLKQALPKFIIWVLIVPFSWFMVQFILSMSAILTVWALTLPYDTFSSYHKEMQNIKIPQKCHVNIRSITSSSSSDTPKPDPKADPKADPKTQPKKLSPEEEKNKDKLFWCEEGEGKMIALWTSMSSSAFWLVSIYSYGILKLDEVSEIKFKDVKEWKIKNIWDLIIHVVFNLIFVVIYMILIIALWLVLAVRWIYLWIYIMLSPVFWLMYFFDKNEGWWDGFFAKFNFKELISLALVPVYVMLALSFWFLFIYVILNWAAWKKANEKISITTGKVVISKTWIAINDIGSTGHNFELVVEWAISEKYKGGQIWSWGWSPLYHLWNSWLWIVWTLILNLFWVVVLWIAVMSALRASEITKAVVEPLHTFWTQVWSLVAKSPQYLPMFPWGQSMWGMQQIWSSASTHFDTQSRDRGSKFMKKNALFGQTNDVTNKAITAIKTYENDKGLTKNNVSILTDAIMEAWNAGEAFKNKKVVEMVQAYAKDSKLEIDEGLIKRAWGSATDYIKLVWILDDKVEEKNLWNIFPWERNKTNLSEKAYNDAIEKGKKGGTDSANSPTSKIKTRLEGEAIKWWSVEIKLKQDTTWLYDIKFDTNLDELAKWISTKEINKDIINQFSQELKDKLDKYFKKDWDKIVFDKDWKWDSSLKDFLS
jgi:hypothetical protein